MTDDDAECPFCWGAGQITVMEPGPHRAVSGALLRDPTGRPVVRPCPEGCLTPEEVPF